METARRSIWVRRCLYVLLAVGLMGLVALEMSRRKAMARFEAENLALRGQAADTETAYVRIAELEEGRREISRALDLSLSETLALRDEVARLRVQTNEIAKLRVARAQAGMREHQLKEKILALQSELEGKPAVPRIGGWLGVSLRDAEQGGVVIMEILRGGPAARSDLQVGDRVLAIDGQAIAGAQDLKDVMRQKNGGQTLAFDVARQAAVLRLSVQALDWPQ